MFISLITTLYRLNRNQWLSRQKLAEIQQRKLKAIIKDSYENVPYYRKLFDSHGVKPEDIRTVEDLSKIPITAKSTIQSLPITEITSKKVDLSKCVSTRTSGTQGIPLTIYFRKEDDNFLDMVWARTRLENGQRLIDKTAHIRVTTYLTHPKTKNWFEWLGIWRMVDVSLFDIKHLLEILEKVNPEVIIGHASELKLLAEALQGQRNKKMHPRLIFTTAELLDANSRRFIASTFGAQLFDCYGTHELGLIAWECSKKSGYHINIDSVVVEFVWNGKTVSPGKEGKLVCTGLHSYAMPFIRYEIGDVGVKSDEKCPCGRGLPFMKIIEGRLADFIVLPSGRMVSPYSLTCAMETVPGIARYQIVQERRNKIVVRLVRGKQFSPEVFSKIIEKFQALLKEEVEIEFKVMEVIPKDSQKFRVVVSKV